ncbi:hypothetical protein PACTADRAFT_49748 [Pachysolen tannophilus NRRL Y-2460]|uniref:CN hydrolase domain-containing protein n=1 Tax=Pachysolen tannophilus NRRL Y-2460 TaxID=669874 RepID=A0A1E4TXJ8_PACTA|nr:hypothetical protein PACTADRAFT_49748 [Pachysolen tannophilus NRRL Y-2460]
MVLIAAAQMCSSSSLKENGLSAVRLITRAVSLNAKILFLPEAADYIAKNAKHSIQIAKSVHESPFVLEIQQKLRQLHQEGRSIFVSVGVHEPSGEIDQRVKNTLLWINDHGDIEKRYQKIHLFNVEIENGPIMRESDSVQPGSEIIPPFDTPAGKLGLAICYDLRFPELALRLRKQGAQLLTFPSAFTMKTGAAHWELLGRARAIDTQSYVILPAQAGQHKTQSQEDIDNGEKPIRPRISYGHTMIIDPWGTVLSQVSDVTAGKEDLCLADIDLERLNTVRKDMPLLDHRRPDVFGYEI